MKQTSNVYVIGPSVGPQKIGVSGNVAARFKHLQSSAPHQLAVHHVQPVSQKDVHKVERLAHQRLMDRVTMGEWFDVTPEEAIAAVKRAAADVAAGKVEPGPQVRTDGLVWAYRYGSLQFRDLEAGLAYRELREAVERADFAKHQANHDPLRTTRLRATLDRIHAAVRIAVGDRGLAALTEVAYKGEKLASDVERNLRLALDVVSRALAATTSAKAA